MPFPTGLTNVEVGPQWTADFIIAVSVLGAVLLVSAGAWAFVGARVRVMRGAGVQRHARLARTAAFNRIAAAITAVALITVFLTWAWLLLANAGTRLW